MRTVTFLVNIGAASDIEADVEVTEKEYRLMKEFSEEGEDFCDCEPLASLYERVIDAAYEAAADAADEDFLSEIMDVDEDYGHEDIVEALKENYELYPCWPDLDRYIIIYEKYHLPALYRPLGLFLNLLRPVALSGHLEPITALPHRAVSRLIMTIALLGCPKTSLRLQHNDNNKS